MTVVRHIGSDLFTSMYMGGYLSYVRRILVEHEPKISRTRAED